ncbi:MAG: hypothetical protein Hyperionvirus2_85 [Hyperionvirus sp.]|uniref:Uncharacterized protein n=1 Tax=Hyperionvirus sp. TaxID=2487770 RepID=A0A3G5A659_9VIRU|nr:MAG: hypothetical protein Hyperionvirus2_85 [Hyperionvirus sp.]
MHTYSKLHVDQLHAKYTEKKHEQQSSLKEIRNLKRKIADDSIVYENQEMYAFLKTKPELYYLFLKATDGKTRRIIDHF